MFVQRTGLSAHDRAAHLRPHACCSAPATGEIRVSGVIVPGPAFLATRVFVTTVELMAPGRQPVAGSLSIDDGSPQQENIEKYLEADLLDDYGFLEWVGSEPHGLGAHNTGMVKDPFAVE
jgi:hypothetical protein